LERFEDERANGEDRPYRADAPPGGYARLFTAPPVIEAKPFTRLPEELDLSDRPSAWARRQARGPLGAFLEGPSFDREGNLWLVDIAHGRIFRIDPAGNWDVVIQYDGQPNGLKIHRDGRVFIADFLNGILVLDPESRRIEPFLGRKRFPGFKGFNDLFFASNGDLYFTDQGMTGLHDPTGRVWRHRAADNRIECLIDTVPSPNGLVMARDESMLYLAVTRANAVWRMPFDPDGNPFKVGLFVQLQGGSGGPVRRAADDAGAAGQRGGAPGRRGPRHVHPDARRRALPGNAARVAAVS